jgi:DNA (cytosine-5)-methyltransferase 1
MELRNFSRSSSGSQIVNLIAIQPLGRNRENARLWIESQRLERLGFTHGIPLSIECNSENLILRPAILGENHVSSRVVAGGRRPIIDLANQSLLAGLADCSEVRIIASFERIEVCPSRRAFAIRRSRALQTPLRVLEVFAGGGTMTAALDDARFRVVAGVEVNPDFADEWQCKHADAALFQADIRALQSSEYPEFDLLIGGIPCTCHSNLGRAKKSLAGRPELGDSGDLFLPVVNLIAERMPAAVVLENVPAFANSLAGTLLASHLEKLGYHVFTTILEPNAEWQEIEDRRRWLLVATLARPFELAAPGLPCATAVAEYLDSPDEATDREDAERIAQTIEGLRRHNARHKAIGHGFAFTVLDGNETRIPTIPKSYHKINTGPFVKTPFGPRLLRQQEIERIHGVALGTKHYSTAVQMLGQGVQARVFRGVFQQLATSLLQR